MLLMTIVVILFLFDGVREVVFGEGFEVGRPLFGGGESVRGLWAGVADLLLVALFELLLELVEIIAIDVLHEVLFFLILTGHCS